MKRDSAEGLRVEYAQRGGIVGGSWSVSVDAAELPGEEARELERLVREADVFALPRSGLLHLSTVVDGFESDLRVVWGERRRHVRLDDTRVPARLRPLLNYLALGVIRGIFVEQERADATEEGWALGWLGRTIRTPTGQAGSPQ